MLLVFWLFDSLTISLAGALAFSACSVIGNAIMLALLRADRFAPWQFWTMLAVDAVPINGWAAAVGANGYLVLPVLVFAISTYAVGLPRAARFLLAGAALLYPTARVLDFALDGAAIPWQRVAMETIFLLVLGALSIPAPQSITRRLKRTREALARIEKGDLVTSLSTRHLDDLGFLSASINSMSQAVGALVQEIQVQADQLALVNGCRTAAETLAAHVHELRTRAAASTGGCPPRVGGSGTARGADRGSRDAPPAAR